MNFRKLVEIALEKTQKFIADEDWEAILQIFQISPKQILYFKRILEEKIRNSKVNNKNPFELIKYDPEPEKGTPDYYKFKLIHQLSLNILKSDEKAFSQDLKDILCTKIYTAIPEVKGRVTNIKLYVEVFYPEIIKLYYEDLINRPKILGYILEINSELVKRLFPKIISVGLYDYGHTLILNHPEIIQDQESAVKVLLENLTVYEKQYRYLIDHLAKINHNLIPIVESSRIIFKSEYINKLINSHKGSINEDLFKYEDKIFRYTFDLYSDSELIEIIKKIIEFEIRFSHYGTQERSQNWANLLLLEIGWRGKSYLFKAYIEEFVRLGYLQVVQGYFWNNPEQIKVYQDFILQKMDSFSLDLLVRKYHSFDIKNPTDLFKKLLYTTKYYYDNFIRIFFEKNLELNPEFKDIMIKYIEEFDFAQNENLTAEYYKIEHLLRYIYIYHPESQPDFNINLFTKFYEKIPSDPELTEVFSHSFNYKVPDNFNLFEKSLQRQIIEYLIESKNLSKIEFFLRRKFQNFEEHLPLILEFEPEHELQSEHFIKVLELIIKKKWDDSLIKSQILTRLSEQKCCHKKAEVYFFLGKLSLSVDVIKKLLENEKIMPYLTNTYLDFQLLRIELCIENSERLDLSECFDEIKEIEKIFEDFNASQSIRQNFLFKLSSYKARLNLYKGFQHLDEYNYENSKEAFKESLNLYKNLKDTSVIEEDTRKIFKIYWKISKFFYEYFPRIERQREKNIIGLNFLLKRHLQEYTQILLNSNLPHQRIIKVIEDIQFDTETKSIDQFKCEIPTKFCRKPPGVTYKRLLDDKENIIFERDKDDIPLSTEPIKVSSVWSKYYLELEFAEKEKYFDFNLECVNKAYFRVEDIKRKPPQSGRVCFEFRLNFDEFVGEEDLEFKITEDDICAFEINVSFPLIHKYGEKPILDETPGYPDLNNELNNQLRELNFWSENTPLSPKAKQWLEILSKYFDILHNFYDHKESFREPAQEWEDEKRDMNQWMSKTLRFYFHNRLRDGTLVSDGDSDHWIDDIPIEDKLLRTSEKLGTDTIIEEKYNKEKKQVFREAGKVGFGILELADIREEIKNNKIPAFPLKKCFKIKYENHTWIAIFLFQAFTKPPSRA